MKITDALLGEHGVFYSQFEYMERALPQSDDHDRLNVEVSLLSASLVAALETHARLEDELLFDALEVQVGPIGPLVMMRQEHQEIEQALSRLPTIADPEEARELILHAVDVTRQHFAKEEQILFPLAERSLGRESLERIGAQWADRRGVMVPKNVEV